MPSIDIFDSFRLGVKQDVRIFLIQHVSISTVEHRNHAIFKYMTNAVHVKYFVITYIASSLARNVPMSTI